MDFGCFSAAAFAECQSHLARNEITENVKNMQITAEICKPVAAFLETWNRLASKVAFGVFLGTILVDFGLILHGF